MLNAYMQQVQRLLSDTGQRQFNPADLIVYINTARGQVAADGECIRAYSSLGISASSMQYAFSSISFPDGTEGVQGVLAVRMITYSVADGQKRVTPREWEWFNRFIIGSPTQVPGPPQYWAQYGQGANGTIFVNPPDLSYTLAVDAVCYPMPLKSDSDIEAVPYLWTDAVPYYAAYVAYLQIGNQDQSDKFYALYERFMARARGGATPSVLPHQYAGTADPTLPNKLGVQQRGAAATE